MIAKHDEIKWAIFSIMQRAGYRAECEVTGLFREFAQNVPESANMRKRDLIVPDLLLKNSTGDRLADVKTLSHTANNYGGRKRFENGAAVNARASRVHQEYRRKARAADRKWNNTPQNAVGPIESRLNEFGTVIPFVFGYLGEANKAVRTCLLYTSPSPRDATLSRMPSSA